jgi:hypothetical protein
VQTAGFCYCNSHGVFTHFLFVCLSIASFVVTPVNGFITTVKHVNTTLTLL